MVCLALYPMKLSMMFWSSFVVISLFADALPEFRDIVYRRLGQDNKEQDAYFRRVGVKKRQLNRY